MDNERRREHADGIETYRWTVDPQWGRGRTVHGPWGVQVPSNNPAQPTQLGTRIQSLEVPVPRVARRVPRVQNLVLAATPRSPSGNATNFILRWELEISVGQVSRSVIIDATQMQQVSVTAERLRSSLFIENYGPMAATGIDDLEVDMLAMQGDGNTSTSAARYTQPFLSADATTNDFIIPPGASSWQIFGVTQLVNVAGMSYVVEQQSGSTLDAFLGSDLLAAHASGQFIPLPGSAMRLSVRNTSGVGIGGAIVYQLEL